MTLPATTKINRQNGLDAIQKLLEANAIDKKAAEWYAKTVSQGASYADLVIQELGKENGYLYIKEEYAQHRIIGEREVRLDVLSIPEALLIENSEEEPWHNGSFSRLSAKEKFQAEAAEPWHPSIRKAGHIPSVEVSDWFNRHPVYFRHTMKILATVYGD